MGEERDADHSDPREASAVSEPERAVPTDDRSEKRSSRSVGIDDRSASASNSSASASNSSASANDSSVGDHAVDGLIGEIAHAPHRAPPQEVGAKWGAEGRYVIERFLGRGGMGIVYAARDSLLGRVIALKMLNEAAGETGGRASLLREARLAAAIEHERIARVYDVGEHEGTLFLAMELVRGTSLRTRMRAGDIGAEDAMRITREIAEGLRELHANGVIHRDLKPENVMLSLTGAKLLDFGLAKALVRADDSGDVAAETGVTAEGASQVRFGSGTPGYMAPEQMMGTAVDARADLFALGVIVFEMVEGRRPFGGDTMTGVVRATMRDKPALTSARWDEMPDCMRRLADRALARKPEERWASAAEVIALLDEGGGGGARKLLGEATDLTRGRLDVPPRDGADGVDGAAGGAEARRKRAEREHEKSSNTRSIRWGILAALGLTMGIGGSLMWKRAHAPAVTLTPPTGMVAIPGGTMMLGHTKEELAKECASLGPRCPRPEILDREQPAFEATIPPFFLDAHEVTNEDFADVLSATSGVQRVEVDDDVHYPRYVRLVGAETWSDGKVLYDLWHDGNGITYAPDHSYHVVPGAERRPVVLATWYGATYFCKVRGKRLPTENEWEAAARGTDSRRYPWGSNPPQCGGVMVPFDRELPTEHPTECSRPTNLADVMTSKQDVSPDGVWDMGGNVAEWMASPFIATARNASDTAHADDLLAVLRGGSNTESIMIRSAGRARLPKETGAPNVGFRCATDAH